MPTLEDFLSHPVETLERALHLRKQIDQLNEALKELFGPSPISLAGVQTNLPKKPGRPRQAPALSGTGSEVGSGLLVVGQTKKRKMSPASRARIAAAQKARWAKSKGEKPEPTPVVKAKKKGGMSAEGRARIAAAQKLRWVKVNKSKQ